MKTINVDATGLAYRKYSCLEVVVVVKQKACRAEGVMNDSVAVSTKKDGFMRFRAKFLGR